MRILLLINSLCAGGAEVFVTDLAVALAQKQHKVALFAYAGVLDQKGRSLQQQLAAADVQVTSANACTLMEKAATTLQIIRLIKTFRPNVVHSHLEQSDLLGFLAALAWWPRRRPRFVRTLHSIYATKRLPAFFHERLSTFFDMNVACGPRVAREYPYLNRSRLDVIENGIRILASTGSCDATDLRRTLGIAESAFLLVNVGSFFVRDGQLPKAQDVMIDALEQVHRTDIHLLLIGDADCREAMEGRVHKQGLSGHVHFLGLVASPSTYLQVADAVIMPSRFEGLSIACIEAACLGKPLILSNIDAFAPFKGPSAVEVFPNDAHSLADGIIIALRDLPAMKKAALARKDEFSKVFDIDAVADRYLRVYHGHAHDHAAQSNRRVSA